MHDISVLFPGQPVVDLEAYMASLEKKQLTVTKMIDTLSQSSDQHATKPFGLHDCFTFFQLTRNDASFKYKYIRLEYRLDCLCSYRLDSHQLRLKETLEPLAQKMTESFGRLGGQLTEMRMDHRDGKLQSDRLTQLLGLSQI